MSECRQLGKNQVTDWLSWRRKKAIVDLDHKIKVKAQLDYKKLQLQANSTNYTQRIVYKICVKSVRQI